MYICGEAALEEAQKQEQFEITDDGRAMWAVDKIAEADAELARMQAMYDAQRDRLDAQMQDQRDKHDREVGYFRGLLMAYFERVPHKETKTQAKYSLLNGDLIRRRGGVDYKRDDAQLVGWLKATGKVQLVKVTEAPAWADLKKTLTVAENGAVIDTETGEIVEGVTAEQKPDTFDVRIK